MIHASSEGHVVPVMPEFAALMLAMYAGFHDQKAASRPGGPEQLPEVLAARGVDPDRCPWGAGGRVLDRRRAAGPGRAD